MNLIVVVDIFFTLLLVPSALFRACDVVSVLYLSRLASPLAPPWLVVGVVVAALALR